MNLKPYLCISQCVFFSEVPIAQIYVVVFFLQEAH